MAYLTAKRRCLKTLGAVLGASVMLGLGAPALLHADEMRSNSYIIQFGNFNLTSGTKTSAGYTVTDTVGQTAPGEYDSTGYKVLSGFQYVYAIPRFSFRISKFNIDLGELQPDTFAGDTNQLTVTTRSGGYVLLARADHPLRVTGGAGQPTIPFTTCNSGCTISSALPWTDPTHVGLGFNISGTHRAADFVNNTYFRPFADLSLSEPAKTIAQSTDIVSGDVTTVSYRATIAGSQNAGTYTTAVDFTAIPSY